MRIWLAYISIILLWATTPLAIKWSGEGPGFLFGVTGRMSIGILSVFLLMLIMRKPLVWTRLSRRTYVAVAVQIYAAMLAVYWGAQHIPSGWISVIFGLTPLMTAVMAYLFLAEASLGGIKILAYLLGSGGLILMFGSALQIGEQAILGMATVLLAAFLQAASAIWVKSINAGTPALSQVAGGLLFAVPAYLATWFMVDGHWPEQLPDQALLSIVYLGVIATSIGFSLYYYVLTHLPATRVALITLITPVLSLWVGHTINHEPISRKIILGTALILLALILQSLGGRRSHYKSSTRKKK